MTIKSSKELLEEEEKNIELPEDKDYWEELVEVTVPKTSRDVQDVFISVGDDRSWLIKAGSTVKIPRCAAKAYHDSLEQTAKALDLEEKLNNAINK